MNNKNIVSTHTLTIEGKEITLYRIPNCKNGNPNYVVHFIDLGIEFKDYGNIKGLKKFNQKWFGGGYVFESYSIEHDIHYLLNTVKTFYNPYASDLHKKGNYKAIAKMERLQRALERATGGGLAGAYLTNAYHGSDCIGMLANNAIYSSETGYIVYNAYTEKAEFIQDNE